MRPVLFYILAVFLSTIPVLAQRNRGGGQGGGAGGGFFPHGGNGGGGGGGNVPNTFITKASAAPATAAPPPAATAASPPAASGATGGGSAGGSGSGSGSGSVDASLIPPFGITAGVKANDGTANCVGDNNAAIPCTCPPDLNTFVSAVDASVAAGAAFPTGNSASDQLARLQTCIVTLQNFKGGAGSGVGCPIVSTNWKELQAQLESEA